MGLEVPPWVQIHKTPNEQRAQNGEHAQYFLFLPDQQSDRVIYGDKYEYQTAGSNAEPSCPAPFTSTRIEMKLGNGTMPPIFTASYGYSDFEPGSPATITVNAVDEDGQLQTVTYYPFGIEVGQEGPVGQETPIKARRIDRPYGKPVRMDRIPSVGYYSFSQLPPYINCMATEQAFEEQMQSRVFTNPVLVHSHNHSG